MSKIRRIKELIPPWEMPSDPVKAVFWFLHWLVKVLVRFFWVAIVGMIVYETYSNWVVGGAMNGIVAGISTLLVGIGVWALLFFLLLFLNVTTGVSRVISEVNRLQNDMLERSARGPAQPFMNTGTRIEEDENVVEGTITDLESERKRRRRENGM